MISKVLLTLLLVLTIIACTSFKYVGENYSSTTEVQVFYSLEEIPVKHRIFGHIVGTPGVLEDFDTASIGK